MPVTRFIPAAHDRRDQLMSSFMQQGRRHAPLSRNECAELLVDDNRRVAFDAPFRRLRGPLGLMGRQSLAVLTQALRAELPQDTSIDMPPRTLSPRHSQDPYFTQPDNLSIAEAADRIVAENGERYQRLVNTGKADLHVHLGGNVSPDLLYELALQRVGSDALNPDAWGGRMDWSGELAFLDFFTFELDTFDRVVARAHHGSALVESDSVVPSQIVLEGQRLRRNIHEARTHPDPNVLKTLQEAEAQNKKQFARLATYKPQGRAGNLAEFMNVYAFHGYLVESATSPNVLRTVIRDALYKMSEQGTRYAEMRVEAPRLDLAQKLFPQETHKQYLFDWMAEHTFTHLIAAVQATNEELISKGLDPVDLRFIYALSKSVTDTNIGHHNLLQTRSLTNLLERRTGFAHYIVGFDGAAQEPKNDPRLYAACFKIISDYNIQVTADSQIGITWHQGEDFSHTSIFGGIRLVQELFDTVDSSADLDQTVLRVGHATVLGMDPAFFYGQEFRMTLEDYEEELDYEVEESVASQFQHTIRTFVTGAADSYVAEVLRVNRLRAEGVTHITGRYPDQDTQAFDAAVRERQRWVLSLLANPDTRTPIEVNPTSNQFMALPSNDLKDHPVRAFVEHNVPFSINTDDQGIFGTQINRELVAIALLLGLTESELFAVIAEGFQHSFAATVRAEPVEALYVSLSMVSP